MLPREPGPSRSPPALVPPRDRASRPGRARGDRVPDSRATCCPVTVARPPRTHTGFLAPPRWRRRCYRLARGAG